MRNPRIDPRQGDVLEHQSGEKRLVVARDATDELVRYRAGSTVSECSESEWRDWSVQTSILDFG